MKIYVTHSTSFDFKNELYEPIRRSGLSNKYAFALPHEKSGSQFNSKAFMKNCDLIVAEVSYPSTGQGIELGWADIFGVPIVSFYRTGTKPSGAVKTVCNDQIEYKDPKDLVEKLTVFLNNIK